MRATYFDEAAAQIDILLKKLNRKRVALVYQDDAYGAACQSAVTRALKMHNTQPVVEVSYPRLTTDVAPIVTKLQAAHPDAVIMGASASALPLLVQKKSEIGPDVQMVGFSSGTDLVLKEGGSQSDGMLISQVFPFTEKDLPTYKLYKSLMQKYEHTDVSDSSFEGFIIAMVVVEALKRAGRNLTREGLLSSLEHMHNVDLGLGNTCRLNFSPTQHDGLQGSIFWSSIDKGALVPVRDWSKFVK